MNYSKKDQKHDNNMKNIVHVKAVFLFVFMLACNLVAAQNYYIRIEGIPGESADQDHMGWIDIESFDQETNSNNTVTNLERRGPSLIENAISFTKKIDKSSPKIMKFLIEGRWIPLIKFEMFHSGKLIYRYELRDVVITNYSMKGDNSARPTDKFEIRFRHQKVIYTAYDRNGKAEGNVDSEY